MRFSGRLIAKDNKKNTENKQWFLFGRFCDPVYIFLSSSFPFVFFFFTPEGSYVQNTFSRLSECFFFFSSLFLSTSLAEWLGLSNFLFLLGLVAKRHSITSLSLMTRLL